MFIELLRGLAKSSHVFSKQLCSAAVSICGIAHWLVVLAMLPCGLRLFVLGWYLCISLVRSCVKCDDGW